MAEYDNKAFTGKIAKLYAERLRERLPYVKFIMDGDDPAVVGEPREMGLKVVLDGREGPDVLAKSIAQALADGVEKAVDEELKRKVDGQIVIVHKTVQEPIDLGIGRVNFVTCDGVGIAGRTTYERKNIFFGKAIWTIGRSTLPVPTSETTTPD